jgi:hypothetical protein
MSMPNLSLNRTPAGFRPRVGRRLACCVGGTTLAMTQLHGVLALRKPRDLLRKFEADFERFQAAAPIVFRLSRNLFQRTAKHLQ